jgi:8-oxo-dGTP pyrophosphatase MutT (NUDIX family)
VYAFPGGSVDPGDRAETTRHDWGARLGLPDEQARAVVGAAVREVLEETGLTLRPDQLHPWARWVTPEFEPRRFDTWFFVARLPEGQEAREVSGESDGTAWIRPDATEGLTMLPPTRATLDSLSAYRSIEEVLAAERDAAVPVQPTIELTGDGGAVLRLSRNDR